MREPYLHEKLKEYLYELPEELIARHPVEIADRCNLLVMDKRTGALQEKKFYELADLLQEGDLLVTNDSAVEARRIFMRRSAGQIEGARIETVFLEQVHADNIDGFNRDGQNVAPELWKALIKKRGRLKNSEILTCEKDPKYRFKVHKLEDGRTFLEPMAFDVSVKADNVTPLSPHSAFSLNSGIFAHLGQMPIPPYLKREEVEADRLQYQNPFGKNPGSAAAPTASLHFTDELNEKLRKKGVAIETITLHVGYGTFAPLIQENFERSSLHREYYNIPHSMAKLLQKKNYKRLICAGTTTLRALESAYINSQGTFEHSLEGYTDHFFKPPHTIESIDGLITNFHLPGSSLLMLSACMSNVKHLMNAYEFAVQKKYRFFSYGDAMFIV